jgi:hypothetical protein
MKTPNAYATKLSIEFEAKLRDAACYISRVSLRDMTRRNDDLSCMIGKTQAKMVFHLGQGKHHGQSHSVPKTSCARLVRRRFESEHRSIDPVPSERQRIADEHKMFGRDFPAGPPIAYSGGPDARQRGNFGGSPESIDYGVY